MIGSAKIVNYLDGIISDPKPDLIYNSPFELLIAVMLSAQTLDKRVNEVTKVLFIIKKEEVIKMNLGELEQIIRPLGNFRKKAQYTKEIYKRMKEINYVVPNSRTFLESLPGVGRKSANVILATVFGENVIAVDTHVLRVANRLGITKEKDPLKVEKDLIKYFEGYQLHRLHHQLVLFGRYYCKAKNPECSSCKLKDECLYFKALP